MNADIAARLREFGQYLDDVDEAYDLVAGAIADAPNREAGALTEHLIAALNSAM